MKICKQCQKIYSDNDFYCSKCNRPLSVYTCEQAKIDQEQSRKPNINIPKCPTCQSGNIRKISSVRKISGAALFGLFSKTALSQFECNNCGYKW